MCCFLHGVLCQKCIHARFFICDIKCSHPVLILVNHPLQSICSKPSDKLRIKKLKII